MGYVTPADVGISDNRQDHLNRGSKEPGTDYKTAYGTDLRVPDDALIIGVDHSNDGAEGRRLTFLIIATGEVIDWIHLSGISVRVGDRVWRGQTGVAWSGASGFGRDWYYGSHLHVTRRAYRGLPYSRTLDFEDAIDHKETAAAEAPEPPKKRRKTVNNGVLIEITDAPADAPVGARNGDVLYVTSEGSSLVPDLRARDIIARCEAFDPEKGVTLKLLSAESDIYRVQLAASRADGDTETARLVAEVQRLADALPYR